MKGGPIGDRDLRRNGSPVYASHASMKGGPIGDRDRVPILPVTTCGYGSVREGWHRRFADDRSHHGARESPGTTSWDDGLRRLVRSQRVTGEFVYTISAL